MLHKLKYLTAFLVIVIAACQNTAQLPSANEPVLFAEHIAPIIYENCSKCHNQDGAAPFSLISYDDIASKAKLIAYVTANRLMPPWPADPTYTHFANETYLTDEQIQLIKRWAEEGSLPGDTAALVQPEILEKKCIPKNIRISLTPKEESALLNSISHSSKDFHQSFTEASFLLVARRIAEEEAKFGIVKLIEKFPQFGDLENPKKFSWADSLLKGLDRHRSLINSYIKQINLLESEASHPSLDFKVISNPKFPVSGMVWRFRINDKYRAWFFDKDDRRIHFFLGDHDYGIR
jgi:hypothetical protein